MNELNNEIIDNLTESNIIEENFDKINIISK